MIKSNINLFNIQDVINVVFISIHNKPNSIRTIQDVCYDWLGLMLSPSEIEIETIPGILEDEFNTIYKVHYKEYVITFEHNPRMSANWSVNAQ